MQNKVQGTKSRGFAMRMKVAGKDHIIEPQSGLMSEAVSLMKKKCKELGVKQADVQEWERA